jgi:hypothetical protein
MRNVPNPYASDGERLEWFRRFTLTPTPPREINEQLRDGQTIKTLDIPGYLGPKAETECETGVALYRLVQLWGTPNVPGMTAGAMEADRDRTTWQYLFDVDYDLAEADDDSIPESFRLSVYDLKTNISSGLSAFVESDDGIGSVHEPSDSVEAALPTMPDQFLEGVVALALNMVDEAVPATYKELWV